MENPFEIILEKLRSIEKAIERLDTQTKNEDDILLSRVQTLMPRICGRNDSRFAICARKQRLI
jgi:hypothetical protein